MDFPHQSAQHPRERKIKLLKMSNQPAALPESHPMNGGDGIYSYSKNSSFQRAASSIAEAMIREVIAEKFDMEKLSSATNVFHIADLGCSVGPNTFIAMNSILEAMKQKYQSQGLTTQMPEFQLFFNDHVSNDFNTLFAAIPPESQYTAAGVPGSFHGRLFPKSSLHFVYTSYALQWLSEVPKEVLDKNSPAWNKGRIHYTNAAEAVYNAYAAQFAKDMRIFLDARAKELVAGGMMVLIMPGIPFGTPHSQTVAGMLFDLLEASLMDMTKEGLVNEELVDSFNLPVCAASPKEMEELVEENDCFSIERMELKNPKSKVETPIKAVTYTRHFRAGMEGIFSKHFGNEIIDELFYRFQKKIEEASDLLEGSNNEGTQLFVVIKRK